jgi:hypothetical protein
MAGTDRTCEWINIAAPRSIHDHKTLNGQAWLDILRDLNARKHCEGWEVSHWGRVKEENNAEGGKLWILTCMPCSAPTPALFLDLADMDLQSMEKPSCPTRLTQSLTSFVFCILNLPLFPRRIPPPLCSSLTILGPMAALHV